MRVFHGRCFDKGLRYIWLAVLLIGLGACATAPKIDWNSRVGTYTHDQAVLELGPPDRSASLTDGTKVVEWLMAHGRIYGFTDYSGFYSPYPYHFYPGPFVGYYSTSRTPD